MSIFNRIFRARGRKAKTRPEKPVLPLGDQSMRRFEVCIDIPNDPDLAEMRWKLLACALIEHGDKALALRYGDTMNVGPSSCGTFARIDRVPYTERD